MKKMTTKHTYVLNFLISAFAALFFTTCEIGLGATVDTEAPVIEISGPLAGAIIRDTFSIHGTWTDDGEVKAVTLSLKDTETQKSYGPFDATVVTSSVGQGTWSYTIEKGQIIDGPYEVTLTIEDSAGHKTEGQRQLTIDNTAPVLVLQRPFSTVNSTGAIETYGQVFTLEGQAADDSGVGRIEVSVYKDKELTEANFLKTIAFDKIPNTISLDLAKFDGSENDYSAIYGSTDSSYGAQTRYCKIVAYDGASCYHSDGNELTEEEAKGNATTGYYLYDDIAETFLSAHTITELYAIKNGRYDDSQSARAALQTSLDENIVTGGSFTLNPRNNPKYTVAGFSELKGDATDFGDNMTISDSDFLTIQVEPGLDGYLLLKDTLKVKVQKYNTSGSYITPSTQTISKDGDKYKIVVYMKKTDGLTTDQKYKLIVEGQDEKGNQLITEGQNGYGFLFKKANVKPELEVNALEWDKTEKILKVSGYITFPSDVLNNDEKDEPYIIISDTTGTYSWKYGGEDNKGTIVRDRKVAWAKNITLRDENGPDSDSNGICLPNGEWVFYVSSGYDEATSDVNGNVTYTAKEATDKITRSIVIDTVKPNEPTLTKVAGNAYNESNASTTWYSSSNMIVEVSATDEDYTYPAPTTADPNATKTYKSGIKSVQYAIGGDTAPTSDSAWSFLSNGFVTGLQDGENKLWFKCIDNVGNSSDAKSYTLMVDTAVPVIQNAWIGDDVNGWTALTKDKVLSINEAHGKQIKLEILEENSLGTVTVNGNTGSSSEKDANNIWTWTSTNPLTLTDNAETSLIVSAHDGTITGEGKATYKVLLDKNKPSINITAPSEDLTTENAINTSPYSLKAVVTDDVGTVSESWYKLTSQALTTDTEEGIIADKTSGSGWLKSDTNGTVTVPVSIIEGKSISGNITNKKTSEGEWYLYIYSIDEAGNKSAEKRSFWTDVKAPTLSLTKAPNTASAYNKASLNGATSGTITLAGSAQDNNGIEKVEYSIDGGNNWTRIQNASSDTNAAVSWSKDLTYGTGSVDLTDGNYTIIVRATDKANKTKEESYNITIDVNPPTVSTKTIDGYENENTWFTSKTIVPKVTVSDGTNGSGVTKVEYSLKNPTEAGASSWKALTDQNGTWTAGVTMSDDDENQKLYLRLTDNAGNIAGESDNNAIYIENINIDSKAPALETKYYQIGSKAIDSDFGGNAYVNGETAMTFWGNYSDGVSGVDELEFALGAAGTKIASSNITIEYSTSEITTKDSIPLDSSFEAYNASNKKAYKSWKAEIKKEALNDGTLYVIGKDIAKNSETVQITELVKDTESPAISNVSVTDKGSTTNAYLKEEGEGTAAKPKIYYVNKTSSFTIAGISSDNNNVKSTTLAINGNSYDKTAGSSNLAWSFDVTDFNDYSGDEVTGVVTATDVAGWPCEYYITIKFDNAAPTFTAQIDGRDYSEADGIWITSKYLTLSGTITETGSGASKVYYKKYESVPSANDKSTFATNYKKANGNDGVIDADTSTSTATYSGTITDLKEGQNNNYILLLVEDNVGNHRLDNVVYHLNVDSTAPTIDTSTGIVYTNGSTPVTVTGTCFDKDSGIEKVEVSITKEDTVIVDSFEATVADSDNGETTSTWTATIPADKLSALASASVADGAIYNIDAVVTDKAQHTASRTVATLRVDKTAPTASLTNISPSMPGNATNAYYIKPSDVETDIITIEGSTDDTYSSTVETWLKLVPVNSSGEVDAAKVYINKDKPKNAFTWKFEIPANKIAQTYSGYNVYVCTKDLAGNEQETAKKAEITFDNAGPTYIASASGDYITKVGQSQYWVFDTDGTTLKENDVWQKDTTLALKGAWSDHSGVGEVYYKVVQNESDAPSSKADCSSSVSVTESNGYGVFNTSIGGFLSGTNYIYLFTTDKLGNESAAKKLTVKVDNVAPTPSEYAVGTESYPFGTEYKTNGTGDDSGVVQVLKFYADDALSGINTIINPTLTLGGSAVTASTAEYGSKTEGKGYLVTVTLKEADFTNKTGYPSVNVIITDKAGNTNSVQIAKMSIDKEAPKVTLAKPKDADSTSDGIQVNGTITITGTANDTNIADEPLTALLYSTDNSADKSTWTAFDSSAATITKVDANNFSVSLKTTELSDGTYYISALSTDTVGNNGYSDTLTIEVDQDTDRPVITLSEIDLPATLETGTTKASLSLKSDKLRGTVSDDDGVKKLEISFDNGVAGSWKTIWEPNDTETTAPEKVNWTYNVTDGTFENVLFRVTDASGTSGKTFTAGAADAPKITDGTNWLGVSDKIAESKFDIIIDNTPPEVQNKKYAYYSDAYSSTIEYAATLATLGGNRKKLAIKFEAGDENHIDSVSAKLGTTEFNTTNSKVEKISEDTDAASDKKYWSTWVIKDIDVSSPLASGSYTITIYITDKAGNTKEDSVVINVDNTPPELAISAPTASTTSSGTIAAYGSIMYAKTAGQGGLYYAVSPSKDIEPNVSSTGTKTVTSWEKYKDSATSAGGTCSAKPVYKEITDFGVTWSVTFDGEQDTATDGKTHDKLLSQYLVDYGFKENSSDINLTTFETLVQFYLWLKAEDEVGNVLETKYPIILDPQGDRPTVHYSYPDVDGETLGGTVSIFGTADDELGTNIGVESVWVQMISRDHGTSNLTYGTLDYDSSDKVTDYDFTWNDLDYMKDCGYTVYKIPTTLNESESEYVKGSHTGNPSDYAAKAEFSGQAWTFSINRNKEFDPTKTENKVSVKNPVGLRIYSQDKDKKLSINNDKLVYFDKDKPVLSDIVLQEYSATDEATNNKRSYIQKMFVRGNWWITGTIADDDAINYVKIGDKELIKDGAVQTVTGASAAISTNKKTATFAYKLGTGTANKAGSISLAIVAKDDVSPIPNTLEENLYINYDNKNPVVASTNISSSVKQTNSFYRVSATITENKDGTAEQSGFAYTALYFMRSYGTTTKLYDVFKKQEVSEYDISTESIATSWPADNASVTDDTKVKVDNIYWFTKNITTTSASQTVTLETADAGKIYENSLVSIGGAYYLVTAIGDDKKTITLNKQVPAGYNKMYVALAAIIDNTNAESPKSNKVIQDNGYYKSEDISFDDGDGMIESVEASGTTWNWDASVCSRNIPDGPITVVCVVFDNAGNSTLKDVSGYVCNNQPRIAGFKIGTDYDGNGTIDKTVSTYHAENANSVGQNFDAGTAAAPVMKVRGFTQIEPEIVGGNDKVYYDYSIGSLKSSSRVKIVDSAKTDGTINTSNPIYIALGDLVALGDSETGIPFEFTFTDDTEGYSSLTSEQQADFQAKLTVYLGVNASAAGTPTATIKPFYWNSLTDNSIYGSSSAKSYADLKGHIELEGDLPTTSFTEDGSGEYDRDPKVSGEIVLKGSASDSKMLTEIDVQWGTNSVKVAEYSSGSLVSLYPDSSYATNGLSFTISNQTIGESGHSLDWELHWNTANSTAHTTTGIGAYAKTDVEVKVVAKNKGAPTCTGTAGTSAQSLDGKTIYTTTYASVRSTPGSTQTTKAKNTGRYRVDIVPYITRVTTSLSSHNSDNPTVYSRTALGHYPVYVTFAGGTSANATATNYNNSIKESVKVSGFNLTGGKVGFEGVTAANRPSYSTDGVTIPTSATSGNVSVYVGSVKSLNNENNDDSRGDYGYEYAEDGTKTDTIGTVVSKGDYSTYKNYYNRIPNDENNNILTDNVVFDIWDINRAAARPSDNSALDIMMHVNPSTGVIGFAFCNGALRFAMPSGTSNSYDNRTGLSNRDFMQCTGFAYDPSGNAYATSAGGESDTATAGRYWFHSGTTNYGIGLTAMGDYNTMAKDRFKSPSIASNGTYTYLAYFDLLAGEIRFLGGNGNAGAKFQNNYTSDGGVKSLTDEENLYQVLATNSGSALGYSGEYVSIGIASNRVVMTWYDAKNNNLMYAYSNENFNPSVGVNKTGWTKINTPLISGAGKYCQLVVDSDNQVHIACYDSANGDLKYVYLSDYKGTIKKTCTVDSYQSVGKELTIDVAKVGNNQIPYIGYWGTTPKKPRHAYLNKAAEFYASDYGLDGVTDDQYTGVWECSIVPTVKVSGDTPDANGNACVTEDSKTKRINVAVWKYNGTAADNGKLAYSTTGTNRGKSNGTNSYKSSYAADGSGVCYGNGSNNAVLAYGVKVDDGTTDVVETAQKR